MTLVFRPHLPLYLRQHPVYCSVHQASRSASSREFCLCLLSHHSSSMRFWGLELRSSRLHRKLFNLSLNKQTREWVAFLGPLNVPINFRNQLVENGEGCYNLTLHTNLRAVLFFILRYQLLASVHRCGTSFLLSFLSALSAFCSSHRPPLTWAFLLPLFHWVLPLDCCC